MLPWLSGLVGGDDQASRRVGSGGLRRSSVSSVVFVLRTSASRTPVLSVNLVSAPPRMVTSGKQREAALKDGETVTKRSRS